MFLLALSRSQSIWVDLARSRENDSISRKRHTGLHMMQRILIQSNPSNASVQCCCVSRRCRKFIRRWCCYQNSGFVYIRKIIGESWIGIMKDRHLSKTMVAESVPFDPYSRWASSKQWGIQAHGSEELATLYQSLLESNRDQILFQCLWSDWQQQPSSSRLKGANLSPGERFCIWTNP